MYVRVWCWQKKRVSANATVMGSVPTREIAFINIFYFFALLIRQKRGIEISREFSEGLKKVRQECHWFFKFERFYNGISCKESLILRIRQILRHCLLQIRLGNLSPHFISPKQVNKTNLFLILNELQLLNFLNCRVYSCTHIVLLYQYLVQRPKTLSIAIWTRNSVFNRT